MAATSIEWSECVWNPVAGCTYVSEGCRFCYAATMTRRLEAMGQKDYTGLTTAKHFNGTVRCLPEKLDIPLRWRKPRRVFVNSMSDLFHEDVPNLFIDSVFAVMALAPQHTFQVLTKRAERMREYLTGLARYQLIRLSYAQIAGERYQHLYKQTTPWPLPNVWLGVSVEDQQRADERIPLLLKTPAAVRFLSCEPLLGAVDLRRCDTCGAPCEHYHIGASDHFRCGDEMLLKLDWVIVGGESGHNARPCNIAWIRSIVQQCRAAGVACFVKQLGSRPFEEAAADEHLPAYARELSRRYGVGPLVAKVTEYCMVDSKGGNPDEWPEDLRVRDYPK